MNLKPNIPAPKVNVKPKSTMSIKHQPKKQPFAPQTVGTGK